MDYSGILRFKTSDGATIGTIALTRQEQGIYTAEAQSFTRAGNYALIVDGVGTTTGTRSFVVEADSVFTAEFVGVTTSSFVGQNIAPIEIALKDRFQNITPLSRPVLLGADGDITSTTVTTQISSSGTMRITELRLPRPGSYTLTVSGVPAITGNRTVLANYGRPIITSITPPEIPIASTTTFRITGVNFVPISLVLFRDQPLVTRFIDYNTLEAILPEQFSNVGENDSLYVKN